MEENYVYVKLNVKGKSIINNYLNKNCSNFWKKYLKEEFRYNKFNGYTVFNYEEFMWIFEEHLEDKVSPFKSPILTELPKDYILMKKII